MLNASPYERTEIAGGVLVTAPGLGSAPVVGAAGEVVRAERDEGGCVLANSRLRVTVDTQGSLSSVRDLTADREVLTGPGNLLQLHPDHPNAWDTWDIDRYYRRRHTDLTDVGSVELVEDGAADGGDAGDADLREVRDTQ